MITVPITTSLKFEETKEKKAKKKNRTGKLMKQNHLLTESNVQTDGIPLRVNDARSLPKLFDA